MCLSWNMSVNDQNTPRRLTVVGFTIPRQLSVAGFFKSSAVNYRCVGPSDYNSQLLPYSLFHHQLQYHFRLNPQIQYIFHLISLWNHWSINLRRYQHTSDVKKTGWGQTKYWWSFRSCWSFIICWLQCRLTWCQRSWHG